MDLTYNPEATSGYIHQPRRSNRSIFAVYFALVDKNLRQVNLRVKHDSRTKRNSGAPPVPRK